MDTKTLQVFEAARLCYELGLSQREVAETKECDYSIARSILGIGLAQLAGTPKVCAVAAGKDKVAAILAACRARIPKILVTDMETAGELLKAS